MEGMGDPSAEGSATGPAVAFAPEDLETVTDVRFDFRAAVPRTWIRQDPANSGGWSFQNPEDATVEIFAFGTHVPVATGDAGPLASVEEDARLTRNAVQQERGEVVLDQYDGGYAYGSEGDGAESKHEVAGWYLEFTVPSRNGDPAMTEVVRSLWADDHLVTIGAKAPSISFSRYRSLFREIVTRLHAGTDCRC
jgi:hypothetical protein